MTTAKEINRAAFLAWLDSRREILNRTRDGAQSSQGGETPEEIEITPEMIRAGVIELRRYDERFECPEDAVLRIVLAVLCAPQADGRSG